MPFSIIRNDITKLQVDAIVNATNNGLKATGGVSEAIFYAAGKERLQKECDKIGYCDTGDAVITKGYGLDAMYVIHTVGPVYGKNPEKEQQQLYSCYIKSLLLAKRKRLSSIAFPVISSGVYGYPKRDAIKIATRAIKDFLKDNEMMVYLVVYDKETFEISEKLFSAVESFIEERMVRQDPRSLRVGAIYSPKSTDDKYFGEAKEGITGKRPKGTQPLFNSAPPQNAADIAYKSKYYASMPVEAVPNMASKPKKRSLQSLLERKTETFSQMLLRLIDEKNMTDVEVYKRANIDRKLFSKMRKKDYTPKKTTVIALAIGLKLNLDEAKDLLRRAGYALTDCSKFDVIIEYFIESGNYDIFEINETLFAFEQQLLGA